MGVPALMTAGKTAPIQPFAETAKMANQVQAGGVSIAGLLGVVFVTLKLCGVISWSWWLVTMPFWLGPALGILFVIVMLSWLGIQHARGVDLK